MSFDISAANALWLLPFCVPICLWVAWNDMKFMKIPNKAVMVMFVVFVVIGFFTLPFGEYAWRYTHLIAVLAIGMFINAIGWVGAGDAKFAAVMAPFIPLSDALPFLQVFAGSLIAAFVMHRVFRMTPAIRDMTPGWESWDNSDFPMGLALGGAMILYLAVAAWPAFG